jgi:SAM-dependent methyltransferase
LHRDGTILPKTGQFDSNAEHYERWFQKHPGALESELHAISSLLPDPALAVEIGVGTGVFASRMGVRVGVEPSMPMARYAAGKGISVALGVAEHLPLGSETFDTALLITTLCFVDDNVMAIREAYRVLKARGSLVVAIIDRESKLGRSYEKNKDESTFYKEARFLNVQELVWYLKEAGFREFAFAQTIFDSPGDIAEPQLPREGYGLGAFVVVRALKQPA